MGNELGRLTNLRGFHISHNALTGNLPIEALSKLSLLETLDINHNPGIRGPILDLAVSSWKRMEYLDLHDTGFSGTIPSDIAQLTGLRRVLIRDTQLQGTIPWESLNQLSHLLELVIAGDAFVGTLPEHLPPNLELLGLESRNITGTFPAVSMIEHKWPVDWLHSLLLQRTSLTGTLPTELGLLSQLKTLSIQDVTGMTGSIPTELAHLLMLNVRGAKGLVGMVPEHLCSAAQGQGDCGLTLQCECCNWKC